MSETKDKIENKAKTIVEAVDNAQNNADVVFDKVIDKRVEPRKYTKGPIRYLSSRSLSRSPLRLKNNLSLLLIIGSALVVCLIVLAIFSLTSVGQNVVDFGSTETNIARQVNYQIPKVASYLGLDQTQVEEQMAESGFAYIEMQASSQNTSTYDLFKLPSDVDPQKGKEWISQGFSRIGSANAAMLFRGGWQFSADKETTTFSRIRYADFDSVDEKTAIDSALTSQTFEDNYVTNDDVDELGNTYKAGTAKYNDQKISWRISALKLSEVYDIGLPENSIYVGIRVELM